MKTCCARVRRPWRNRPSSISSLGASLLTCTCSSSSRKAVQRIYTLALLYRLTSEQRWLDRALTEMLTAARMDDWNPAHWLDTAEMMNALATGYDWLYHALTPDQRGEIRQAIVEKGLREAEIAYWDAPENLRRDLPEQVAWWARNPFNWNNVCNGGIIIGALAVAEDVPELAEKLLKQAVQNLPYALASYAPDGAWAEGPGYWGYATQYTTLALAALESALGSDFDLGNLPGLADAGWFRMHGAGPTGRFFNFADAAEDSAFDPSLYYLALRYQNPSYARAAEESRRVGRAIPRWSATARALLWYDPHRFKSFAQSRPHLQIALDAHYQHTHLAFFRSAWNDPEALYVGFKGGDNKANHSHLDLGSFVFDALGQRWVSDLSGDEYTLPGYWETRGRRWGYYRLGTSGHNTLRINGQNQDPQAEAPLTHFSSDESGGAATADLTSAYAPAGAQQVTRTVELSGGRRVLRVIDEVQLAQPGEVEWRMHTPAEVSLSDGDRVAVLYQDGQRMSVTLVEPEDAVFTVESAYTEPPQRPLEGVSRLMVRLLETEQARIVVRMMPRS